MKTAQHFRGETTPSAVVPASELHRGEGLGYPLANCLHSRAWRKLLLLVTQLSESSGGVLLIPLPWMP